MTEPDARIVRGSCLCGAVQLEITLPTKWCAHCHCSKCRRAHGAAFVTWVGVHEERFRVLGGEDVLVHFASSPQARRSFCGHCGTSLLFRSERWPGEVHVVRVALEGELDREPAAHVFFDDRARWIDAAEELPRYGGPTGTEPLEP